MFSLDSFSCVQCIKLDFFSTVLKLTEQQNLHFFFSKRLNEEELSCVHSMQNGSLKYHWNCDYNTNSHCRPSFSLMQREGWVGVLAFWFGSEQRPDPSGMCQHPHECGSGSGLAWDTWPQHVPSTQRSSSLLATAHVAIPSPNFISGIPQPIKRFWVAGESSIEPFRVKAWLGCVVPDPTDRTLPRVKALFQSRIDTKIFLIEVLNYSAGIHHLTSTKW